MDTASGPEDRAAVHVRCYDCDASISMRVPNLEQIREFIRAHEACAAEPWADTDTGTAQAAVGGASGSRSASA